MPVIDLFHEILPIFRGEVRHYVDELKKTPTLEELSQVIAVVKNEIQQYPNLKRLLRDVDQSTLEDVFVKVERQIKSSIVTTNDPGIVLKKMIEPSWITELRISSDDWHYWRRYVEHLKKQGRADQTINEIERSTLTILELLGDPLSPSVFKKGVVVGNVQSGKTSNFNGVINRAVDVGYKLIIVFSGIMDDLRVQTQDRIESDVIGWGTVVNSSQVNNGVKGVGRILDFGAEGIRQIEAITSIETDFNRTLQSANFSFANPKVLVCKKNHHVLANLIYWIATSIPEGHRQMNIPLLLLDDEADNASLNNLGHKGVQYASKINGHLRALLNLFNRKSYLGYTATPFANILQDQQRGFDGDWKIRYRISGEVIEKSFQLTSSLFPEDFMYKIGSPNTYIGPKLLFESGREAEGEKKLPLICPIDDYASYFPVTAKKGDILPTGIPPSLIDAIDCFILSIALRLSRESHLMNTPSFNPHHSMLVHISRYTSWQNETADKIKDYVQSVSQKMSLDKPNDPESIYSYMHRQWNRFFAYEVENMRSFLPSDYYDPALIPKKFIEDIMELLPKAVKDIEVKAINSDRKEHLNYSLNAQGEGRKVIAVGGNRLSRGFTLEGLSINYFIRDSSYYDALLQMGRWFGYRPGYIDACRLFIDNQTRDKYNFITRAVVELEELFEVMNNQVPRRTPKDFELRIRKNHNALKITRPSILKNAKEIKFTFQNETIETYRFLIEEQKLRCAYRDLQNLIKEFSEKNRVEDNKQRGFFTIKVDFIEFLRFLKIEKSFVSTESFVLEDLIKYIELANQHGYLKNWVIGIQKTGTGKLISNGQLSGIQTSKRTGPKKTDEGPKSDVYYRNLRDSNVFVAGGNSARIVSAGTDESLGLDPQVIKDAEYAFRQKKTEEIMEVEKIPEADAKKKASKTTLPGWIYRKSRNAQEGLLLIYLIDMDTVLDKNDPELRRKVSKEVFEDPVPLIGYAFSIPEIPNDPGGDYFANEVSTEDLGAPVPDELEAIEDTEDPVIL